MFRARRRASQGRALRGREALQSGGNAVTLRYRDGKVSKTDGPFAETKEILGGILFLEAEDLDHAVRIMSKHPASGSAPSRSGRPRT
jgi:hypothetical protein